MQGFLNNKYRNRQQNNVTNIYSPTEKQSPQPKG